MENLIKIYLLDFPVTAWCGFIRTFIKTLKNHMKKTKCENTRHLRHDVFVVTNSKSHSTKPELKFHYCSNPAHRVSEKHNRKDFSQWSLLKIRLNPFPQSIQKPSTQSPNQ